MRINDMDLRHILTLAKKDFELLRNARIFITGGTGYIGRWLLESLLYANNALTLRIEVVVLSRRPTDFILQNSHIVEDPAFSIIVGDVRNFKFPEGEFTHVIHAATDVIATPSPLETFDVIVDGTRRLLDFCTEKGVKHTLLLSSGAVYGQIPANLDLVPETYTGAPVTDSIKSAYGIGKLASEWLGTIYSVSSCFSCKYARVFAQVGPYLALDKQFAAGNFILNAIKGDDFVIKGDGTPRRSYMYGTDLVIWLLAILVRGSASRAYNVGSDESISISELAVKIAGIANVPNPIIKILQNPVPGSAYERYVPDIARARDELGLIISIPLEEALRRTINWYRPFFK